MVDLSTDYNRVQQAEDYSRSLELLQHSQLTNSTELKRPSKSIALYQTPRHQFLPRSSPLTFTISNPSTNSLFITTSNMSSTNNLHGLTMEQFKELRSKTIAAKDVAYCKPPPPPPPPSASLRPPSLSSPPSPPHVLLPRPM